MPLAWDRTSLSQPAPTSDNGHLPDAGGKASAQAVYKFLDAESKKLASWSTSPLWSVVDGPMTISGKLGGNFTSTDDLRNKVLAFIAYFNRTMAKPFKWTYQGKPLHV